MPRTHRKNSRDSLIAKLGQLSGDAARRGFFARHKTLIRKEVVEQLAQLVLERVRVSTSEALHLAEAAVLIAKKLKRKEFLALALRQKANALYSSDRKSTRLNSSHSQISYAVFCLKKKKKETSISLCDSSIR